MFKIKSWYGPGGVYKIQQKITISCSNCGKEKIIDVDIINTTFQDIITTFLLNKMLHHVGMLWII